MRKAGLKWWDTCPRPGGRTCYGKHKYCLLLLYLSIYGGKLCAFPTLIECSLVVGCNTERAWYVVYLWKYSQVLPDVNFRTGCMIQLRQASHAAQI